MSEHPILFSGPMVRAILEGRKSQTRRVIKPQPHDDELDEWPGEYCPYGQPGDRLWVRETHWQYKNRIELAGYCADGEQTFEYPVKKYPSIFMPRWASRITLEIVNIRVERLQEITEEDAEKEGVDHLFTPEEVANRPELTESASHFKNYMWHGHYGSYGGGNKFSDSWPIWSWRVEEKPCLR